MLKSLKITLGFAIAIGAFNAAFAQDDAANYPEQPVTLVVGFSPGGSTDNLARVIVDDLSRILGQPVVVENRPGAGGYVGYRSVAASEPDGYTILLAENAIALGKALRPDEPLDPVNDLEPIGRLALAPMALIVHSGVGATTLDEVVELSRTVDGGINFSSSGVGSVSHMTFEALASALDMEAVHVPFSGGGEANAAVGGGHVHAMMQSVGSSARMASEGSVKPIVVTSPERVEPLGDVPTLAESGLSETDVELRFWWGVFVPAGTPEPIKAKLAGALQELSESEQGSERMINIQVEPAFTPAEEMSQLLQREIENWSVLVEERGLQPQ